MGVDQYAQVAIQTWEEAMKANNPGFVFNDLEKHFIKLAFEAGYRIAQEEINKK